jgi:hypothetical protein
MNNALGFFEKRVVVYQYLTAEGEVNGVGSLQSNRYFLV